MQVNKEWISISDMMSGLMMIFLFIAILFMNELQKSQHDVENIINDYKNINKQLNLSLREEFKNDLKKWDAQILSDNTIRFKSPEVLFQQGKSEITDEFITILNDFFPRYLYILTNIKYKDKIKEIRIEGHTSSEWSNGTIKEDSYILNMNLSQDRSRIVLNKVFKIIQSKKDKEWLIKVLRANGMSFSVPIINNGIENESESRRVEFKIATKAEENMNKIIEKFQ